MTRQQSEIGTQQRIQAHRTADIARPVPQFDQSFGFGRRTKVSFGNSRTVCAGALCRMIGNPVESAIAQNARRYRSARCCNKVRAKEPHLRRPLPRAASIRWSVGWSSHPRNDPGAAPRDLYSPSDDDVQLSIRERRRFASGLANHRREKRRRRSDIRKAVLRHRSMRSASSNGIRRSDAQPINQAHVFGGEPARLLHLTEVSLKPKARGRSALAPIQLDGQERNHGTGDLLLAGTKQQSSAVRPADTSGHAPRVDDLRIDGDIELDLARHFQDVFWMWPFSNTAYLKARARLTNRPPKKLFRSRAT